MHHDLLLTIEDALFGAGAAVDLSSYGTAEEARAAAEQCPYIRGEGWAAIEDNDRIDRMSASFLDVAGMIRRSIKLGLEDSAEDYPFEDEPRYHVWRRLSEIVLLTPTSRTYSSPMAHGQR